MSFEILNPRISAEAIESGFPDHIEGPRERGTKPVGGLVGLVAWPAGNFGQKSIAGPKGIAECVRSPLSHVPQHRLQGMAPERPQQFAEHQIDRIVAENGQTECFARVGTPGFELRLHEHEPRCH